jgi:hypothetical protein
MPETQYRASPVYLHLVHNNPALQPDLQYIKRPEFRHHDRYQLYPSTIPRYSSGSDEEAGVARAQGYLIDFLSILSDIEKNYSLDDDE